MRKQKTYKIHIHLKTDRFLFKVDKVTDDDINYIVKRIKHYPGLMVENLVGSDWYVIVGVEFVLYRALYTMFKDPNNSIVFEKEITQ